MDEKNILYFDDEKWFAESLKNDLEKTEKYKVDLVTMPVDFFSFLKEKPVYDMIILDIMIPMENFTHDDLKELTRPQVRKLNDGLDVGTVMHDYIRQKKEYETVPILFYSAKNNAPINVSNSNFITKPESISIIEAVIDKLLTK